LTLQLYTQLLFAVGDYANFKELARPSTIDFNVYGEGGSRITPTENGFDVDPDGSGVRNFAIEQPNFNFKSLRGNAVLRWEYLPGSTFFFVWTQSRSSEMGASEFNFGRDVQNLWSAQPDNIFLLKITYWLNP
ncbi:MAG: hypothetical protein IAF08_16525, partial [Rhizobacter sp.]|nr:hypothetical protein [Chlorobiales bacterium]